MYTNVLIGIDEDQGGRDAIALATQLVSDEGSLTFGHVHNGYPLSGRGASPAWEASERERSLGVLRAVREGAGVDAKLQPVGASRVGRGLHELAESIGADLLVVGSTSRGRLGRVFLGDDTTGALDGARCAVAVAPAGYADHPRAMREIGVAYNGTRESRDALVLARELAREHGAALSAFEAVELPATAFAYASIPIPVDEMLEAAREQLAALDGVQPHAVYGMAGEELALYSASVDLLVIGSRGYGPLGRLVHGSTTRQLLRSARCPLLTVTRTTSAAAAHESEALVAAAG